MSFLAPIAFRIAKDLDQIASQCDRVFRNHDSRIREIVDVPILRGRLVVDKDVDTSGVEVFHGLGRTPIGCIVVKSDAAVSYKRDNFNSKSIEVTTSSGSSTVSLWIF